MLRKLRRISFASDLLLCLDLIDTRLDRPDPYVSWYVFELYAPNAPELNLRLCYLNCCNLLDVC